MLVDGGAVDGLGVSEYVTDDEGSAAGAATDAEVGASSSSLQSDVRVPPTTNDVSPGLTITTDHVR